jgi:hypothetical protein
VHQRRSRLRVSARAKKVQRSGTAAGAFTRWLLRAYR